LGAGQLDISRVVQELKEALTPKGVVQSLTSYSILSKKLDELVVGLADFTIDRIEMRTLFLAPTTNELGRIKEPIFAPMFQRKISTESYEYPTEAIKDLVDYVESKRQNTGSNIINFLAGLIGALIGALATMLFSR
jgi:hypothetical protein